MTTHEVNFRGVFRWISVMLIAYGCGNPDSDQPATAESSAKRATDPSDPKESRNEGLVETDSPLSSTDASTSSDDITSTSGEDIASTSGEDTASTSGDDAASTASGSSYSNPDTADPGDGSTAPASDSETSVAVCGDAVVTFPEACDDGNTETETLCTGPHACTFCASDCMDLFTTEASSAAIGLIDGGSAYVESYGGDVIGWRFEVTGPEVIVTALGYMDYENDGLHEAHDVGIYAIDDDGATEGELVVSSSIPAGDEASLYNGFRYVPVDPVSLLEGRTYVILAYRPTSADVAFFFVSEFETPDFLLFDGPVGANLTGGLVFTNQDTPDEAGYFGPSFLAFADPRAE